MANILQKELLKSLRVKWCMPLVNEINAIRKDAIELTREDFIKKRPDMIMQEYSYDKIIDNIRNIPKEYFILGKKDVETLTLYLFNFRTYSLRKEIKELAAKVGINEAVKSMNIPTHRGAIDLTFTNKYNRVPTEEIPAKDLGPLYILIDGVKFDKDYKVDDIKNVSATGNFIDWSITVDVTMKDGSRDVIKYT